MRTTGNVRMLREEDTDVNVGRLSQGSTASVVSYTLCIHNLLFYTQKKIKKNNNNNTTTTHTHTHPYKKKKHDTFILK